NFFENVKTVQFTHRMGAYVVFVAALWHALATWRAEPGTPHARRAVVLFAMVTLQAVLGIFTLVTAASLHPAITHHAFAIIVLGFAAAHWRATKGSYPSETRVLRA